MPRPLRKLYPMSSMVRRRHRTWIMSMTLATAGAALWGAALLWSRIDPAGAPTLKTTLLVSSAFTVPGTILAFLTLRARTIWIVLAGVALCANAMMIVLPWIALRLRS
jgi:hypothetical protein